MANKSKTKKDSNVLAKAEIKKEEAEELEDILERKEAAKIVK